MLKNLNLNFERVVMMVYSFSERKNHLQTPIGCKSCDFSCHSTEPTQEAWKLQFWPADFPFPSMAAALYLCPKLGNRSRRSCLRVTFKWLNHMKLAQWELLGVSVRPTRKWAFLPAHRFSETINCIFYNFYILQTRAKPGTALQTPFLIIY